MSEPAEPIEPPKPLTDSGGDSRIFGVTIRGWLAVILVVTVCGMSWINKTISEPLYSMATLALGFYFGQKNSKPNP